MAKKELTEQQKARREVKRNHILGWGLGLGGGSAILAAVGVGIAKAVTGTFMIDNSFFGGLSSLGPVAGAVLAVATTVGIIIGSVLANNETHLNKHLQKRVAKEEKKNKVKTEEVVPEEVETLAEEQNHNVVTVKSYSGEVIKTFHQVAEDEASYEKGTFGNKVQLQAVLAKNMPGEDCIIEYNGETVSGFSTYKGEGTMQTANNENVKAYRKVIGEVVDAIYGREAVVSHTSIEEEEATL